MRDSCYSAAGPRPRPLPGSPGHRPDVAGPPGRGARHLSASPRDTVLFALLALEVAPLAWDLAHSLGLDHDRTWSELAKAYEPIDPLAVLPVLTRLVEYELVEAGAQHYRTAARRLASCPRSQPDRTTRPTLTASS